LSQEKGNNLCAFYICDFIHISTSERRKDVKHFEEMWEKLLPKNRVRAIQEDLEGFFLKEVIYGK
jgi:hypothetical protein